MGQYDLFRKIAQSSLTEKQRTVNLIQNDIIDDFKISPSYCQGYINDSVVLRDFHIITDRLKNNKKLLSYPNETFNVGDVINIVTLGIKFLVVDIDEDQQIQTKGTIQPCNNTLLFYSPNESTNLWELKNIPCIVGKGNISLDTNKFISLPANEYIVVCPDNIDSSGIKANIRFLLSGSAYVVLGIDNISMNGLLNIRVKEDVISVDDNLELGIANYYSRQSTQEIYILNGTSATLLYSNATLQLDIQCKENGIVVDNLGVVYSSNQPNVANVDNTGLITAIGTGDAIITAQFGTVSDSINIHNDMIVSDNYSLTMTPSDTTLQLNKNKIFTTHFFNNGVEVFNQNCIWNLINSDGTSNVYATIAINGFDCTVTASNNSQYAGKYVKLRSTLVSDSTKYIEREIKLIGLF